MSASRVVYLQPRARSEAAVPDSSRVIGAFSAALLRVPPKPAGLVACVAHLQEPAETLLSRDMALRALQNLRTSLFVAPGRDSEMTLLWREALATACYARVVAGHGKVDAPLLTGAGLLHRAGEIVAVRALAHAEQFSGQRLVGPVMQQILEARDDALVARVTRSWALPGELRLLILRWRAEQEQLSRSTAVDLLTMAQALATELVHGDTCAPGLAQAASEALKLPSALLVDARQCRAGIAGLLEQVAPVATS